MTNTQGEHSIDAVACPATQALNMMNNDPSSFLPHNSLATADRVADKLSMEMKAFHLTEAEGNASTMVSSTSNCSPDALGESSLVSPSPSHTSLHKYKSSGQLSSSTNSFDLSGLARATEPVEASVAFPVIEWSSDDDESCGDDNDDDKSFLASRAHNQSSADFDDDEDEDDESAPVLFRPGSALSSSGMRKRCSDDISSASSGMHRTKSRRSCLNSLSANDHGSIFPAHAMPSPCSSSFGDASYHEFASYPLSPSHAAPSQGCSSWGQFIQPGTEEDDGSVPVLFAVTLTPTTCNRKGGLKPARRVSRLCRSS